MTRKSIFPTILCIAVLVSACGKKPAPPPRPPKPVTSAVAETQNVPIYLDQIGRCSAFETVNIQPQVSGPIVAISFTDGSEVKQGDPLFTIDPRPYKAALDKAKAQVIQDQAKAAFDQEQLKRNEILSKTKVTAPQDLDSARSAAAASQAALLSDAADVETAQINYDYCFIRSPINGRTGKRLVDVGNVVAANSTQLLQIQRQDPIYAEFTVPEGTLPRVREFLKSGDVRVQASFPDDPTKSGVGKLDFLDSGVQASTGTVQMRATLDNSERLFWPGQFVNIRILLDTLKDAVLVPAEAVQTANKGPFVFVIKADQTVEQRPIKPGQRQGDNMVILEGLKAGETVVVTGQLALSPGAEVTVVTDQPAK